MNPALVWLKKNWLIVVLSVVAPNVPAPAEASVTDALPLLAPAVPPVFRL